MIRHLVLALLTACSYSPPGAFGPETDGQAATDGGIIVIGDGGTGVDTPPPPDGSVAVLLEQTSGIGMSQSVGCTTNGGATISDGAWYRVFPLANFGITGTFTMTTVSVWLWKTSGTRIATVTIGAYTGGFQNTGFARSQFTTIHQGDVTMPSVSPNGQLVTLTLQTPLVINAQATPQIAIEISSSSILLGSASANPQTAWGYFGSNTCGQTASIPPNFPNSHFILQAEGFR